MDLSNLSVKDLSSRIKRLEEIDRVLNDSNRTKLSRRLAVEQYRGDLAEYNVVSLEEPSALKKAVGIALALLGITLMAKIWASVSDSGSGNGKSSSGGSSGTTKAIEKAMDSGLTNSKVGALKQERKAVEDYLKQSIFIDPAKQKEQIDLFWKKIEEVNHQKVEAFYELSLLLGQVNRGVAYREIYKDPSKFKSGIDTLAKMTGVVKMVSEDLVKKLSTVITQLNEPVNKLDVSFVELMEVMLADVANKVRAAGWSVDAKKGENGNIIEPSQVAKISGDNRKIYEAELKQLGSSLTALRDNFKRVPDPKPQDIAAAAQGMVKIFGDGKKETDITRAFDDFIKQYESVILGSAQVVKSLNDEQSSIANKRNDPNISANIALGIKAKDNPSDPNFVYYRLDCILTNINDYLKFCSRVLNTMKNLDQLFSTNESAFVKSTSFFLALDTEIKKATGGQNGVEDLAKVAKESYDPYEIAASQLFSIVPRRQISIESNATTGTLEHFDEFEFSSWVDNVSQKWLGEDVQLSWSTESLNQVAEYCRAVGIETQSTFEDTFYSRGLALEDLSKAKKFGILLAILASFGGLFALWKHFRNKDKADAGAVGSVGETTAAVETNSEKIAEGSKDIADQIRQMKFTGPDAERNLKAVKHLKQAVQKLVGKPGTQEEEDKQVLEFFEVVGKGKANAIYVEMAKNGHLHILSSRFIAEGPFGQGNSDKATYQNFFTVVNSLASYLPKLSHRAITMAETYVAIVNDLATKSELDKSSLDECKQKWQTALDTNKAELDGFLKALEEAEALCKLEAKSQELKKDHERIRDVISAIRSQFERLDASKISDQNAISDGVKALSECGPQMEAFVTTWADIGSKAHGSGGLDLDTLEKRSNDVKGLTDKLEKARTLFTESKTKNPDLLKDQKDADLLTTMGNGTKGAVDGLSGLSSVGRGVERNIDNFRLKMEAIKEATEDMVKAMNLRSKVATESMDSAFTRLRLPPGLSLEVFADDTYMDMTDGEYLGSFELLSDDLDRLDQDTLEVEQWVERIRLRRSISQEDARYIEQFCPGLLTNKRPLATFTKFPSGTNLQISLEEGGALATGMKVAVFAALAALVVRGAMWMKTRFENSSNSLAAIKNYQEEIEKATKRTDAQSVSLRQLLEGDNIADRELDLADGFKFKTKGGESAIHDLRDECIRKEMANRNWDKNAKMESAIDSNGAIHKMFMPVQTFVLENIEVVVKTLDQVKSQVKGGSGTVTQTSATQWKGIDALQSAVGGGNITGIDACAASIKSMIETADGAQPSTKADSLTYADLDKKRVELMKSFKDIDKSVIKKLDKLLDKAKGLETSAASGQGDDAQRQAAKDSAKAAQENVKSLQSLVAAHSGATEIYKQFYEAFLAGLNRYGKLMTEIQKKATSSK